MDWIRVLAFLFVFGNSSAKEAENFTDAEKIAIQTLRETIRNEITHDYQLEDSDLIGWLRARNLKINDAAEMFRESQKWRKENKIDAIVNETIKGLNPTPYTIDGFDREGRPLLIFSPTHIDLRKVILQGQRDKIIRVFLQMIEKGGEQRRAASKRLGKDISKSVAILDIHGYNLRQHFCISCVSVYREWFTSLEKYYPQRVQNLILINVPKIAIPLIESLRPLLAENTAKVLKIFSTNRKEWSEHLLSFIDADQLPYRFGGTKKPEGKSPQETETNNEE